MRPTDAELRRYARHLLLVEIGEDGQRRLCAAQVSLPRVGDARAARWAQDYLERAGVQVGGGSEVALLSTDQVERLAGDPLLEEAAAALSGAFAAVEAIKAITSAGTPATLPHELVLATSEDPA